MLIVIFLAALALAGLIGTSAASVFVWPAYTLFGAAGVLSAVMILRDARFRLPAWGTLAVFALVGYILVRAAQSPVIYFAREDAVLAVGGFLVYGLFLRLFDSTSSRRRLFEVLALLVVLNLVYALLQVVAEPTLWVLPGYERTFPGRIGGLFNHPDHFAGFLAVLTPVWLAMACFSRRSKPQRIAAAALGIVSGLVVLGCGSGGGFVALAAGGGVFALILIGLAYRKLTPAVQKIGRRAVLITVGLSLLVTVVGAKPLTGFVDRAILSRAGDLYLPAVWNSGLRQFQEAPALGTGSRSSIIYGRLYRPESLDAAVGEPEFIHNEYLQALADYGIVGLALVLLVLLTHAFSGGRFVRAYANFTPTPGSFLPKSDHLAHAIGALGALAGLAGLAALDFVLHLPAFAVFTALMLGVLAAPDPMATASQKQEKPSLLPSGGWHFASRAFVTGFGLALAVLGSLFSRSEYHYELARLAFDADRGGYQHLNHLKNARELDPVNPFALTLSAHAQVAGIQPGMPQPARQQALAQADGYFARARHLYPQDVYAAIGHAAVLDELGRGSDALARLREAMDFAPAYGNLMLAEAEHHLRRGDIAEAEQAFRRASRAAAFRDAAAVQRGLLTVTEWKLIAEKEGIDWRIAPDALESAPVLAGPGGYRSPSEAVIEERVVAGKATDSPVEVPTEPQPAAVDRPIEKEHPHFQESNAPVIPAPEISPTEPVVSPPAALLQPSDPVSPAIPEVKHLLDLSVPEGVSTGFMEPNLDEIIDSLGLGTAVPEVQEVP